MKQAALFFIVLIAVFPAWGETVVLPPECRSLTEHRPAADVAFKPGEDARGKKVVPADINAAPMGLSAEPVVIPLTVDLARRLQNQNIDGLELKGTLGFLEVAPSGRVTYNGQDLTPQVYAVCDQSLAPAPVPAADGQTTPDTIKSTRLKENAVKAKPVQPPAIKRD